MTTVSRSGHPVDGERRPDPAAPPRTRRTASRFAAVTHERADPCGRPVHRPRRIASAGADVSPLGELVAPEWSGPKPNSVTLPQALRESAAAATSDRSSAIRRFVVLFMVRFPRRALVAVDTCD